MNSIASDLRHEYHERGLLTIDTKLDESVLDGAKRDLIKYFGDNREHPIHVPHADHNRIQDAWYISQNVLTIAQAPAVLEVLANLYGAKVSPFQTLNFYTGTQQPVHADSIHFNSEPFGSMCGVWVALEDIGPDQGPLVYYPGSQELPEMNYDYFGLPASYDNYPQYLGELEKIIAKKGYQPEFGILKKGQAVIWSANILHGGSTQHNKELTRQSQVTHYYVEGLKYWRPSQSNDKRFYFKPDWVHDVSGQPYKFPIDEPVSIRETTGSPTVFYRRLKSAITRRIFRR